MINIISLRGWTYPEEKKCFDSGISKKLILYKNKMDVNMRLFTIEGAYFYTDSASFWVVSK